MFLSRYSQWTAISADYSSAELLFAKIWWSMPGVSLYSAMEIGMHLVYLFWYFLTYAVQEATALDDPGVEEEVVMR